MKLALIAAHDPNLVIGKDGDLPWHYPEDLKHFKKTTLGHPVLMGRGEFEELGEKPLPGRENVVLSRSKDYDHVPTFESVDKALEYLQNYEWVFVIGGGEIYKQTIDRADKLVITQIHKEYEGDTWFPEYRGDIGTVWRETNREEYSNFTIVEYERMKE